MSDKAGVIESRNGPMHWGIRGVLIAFAPVALLGPLALLGPMLLRPEVAPAAQVFAVAVIIAFAIAGLLALRAAFEPRYDLRFDLHSGLVEITRHRLMRRARFTLPLGALETVWVEHVPRSDGPDDFVLRLRLPGGEEAASAWIASEEEATRLCRRLWEGIEAGRTAAPPEPEG